MKNFSNLNSFILTRIKTLCFKSSGDGKIDGSLFGNGFVSNRSSIKIQSYIQSSNHLLTTENSLQNSSHLLLLFIGTMIFDI
jgi:hypothetical protein